MNGVLVDKVVQCIIQHPNLLNAITCPLSSESALVGFRSLTGTHRNASSRTRQLAAASAYWLDSGGLM